MHQAITTKFLGPTNFRGARVKATCQAASITLNWDHALNHEQNHNAAARALALKLGWRGRWVGGALPDGCGNCYCLYSTSLDAVIGYVAFELDL